MPEPDARFSLAAERTHLAYVRTSLALFGGSIVALGYLDHSPHGVLGYAAALGLFVAGLVVIVPLTTRDKKNSLHVPVDPPEGGVTARSFAKCEDVRSLSKDRLKDRWGRVEPATLAEVEDRLRVLLGL